MSSNQRQSYPPILKTSDPDSFAAFTFRQRLPGILDQIIAKNTLADKEAEPLRKLKKMLHAGTVQHCLSAHPYMADHMGAGEYQSWRGEIEKHIGRNWLDLPWYFAESLFYLEVLLAWGYYCRDSRHYAVDPYRLFKEEELNRRGGALDLAARIAKEIGEIDGAEQRLAACLRYCLWANRVDLSYSQLHERYMESSQGESNQLLVDHSEQAIKRLLRADRIDMILDNSGSELIADLHLANTLLQRANAHEVVLHCKKAPYYVSDATIEDVEVTIRSLEQSPGMEPRRLGRALSRQMERGTLLVETHYFWNGPLHFPNFPPDLKGKLRQSDLTVLKGDLNYRRLLNDRRWDPATPMEQIVGYFPTVLVTLRTTKSELITDIAPETVRRLDSEDPNWLTEGRYGIIRYCDPQGPWGRRNSTMPLSL